MTKEMYGALILSCSSYKAEDLVKLILDAEDLPEAVVVNDKAKAYPWSIETKYYTTDINLFTISEKDLVSQNFAEGVQAVVIYFDSTESKGLESVSSWLPFIDHFSPEVQILVCHNCTNKGISRRGVLDWCLENQFELVELSPDELSDNEEEDDFKETTGCKRIVQALHAHMWPNMKIKENPNIHNSAKLQELMRSESSGSSETKTSNDNPDSGSTEPNENNAEDNLDSLLDGNSELLKSMYLDNPQSFKGLSNFFKNVKDPPPLDESCDDPESFEELFSIFQDMKETASTLHGEERKKYAEKVAVAFWKAMGGEEDEIAGLSDEET